MHFVNGMAQTFHPQVSLNLLLHQQISMEGLWLNLRKYINSYILKAWGSKEEFTCSSGVGILFPKMYIWEKF